MSKHPNLAKALADISGNEQQIEAVNAEGHCVVLAGPGSGKTKVLTISMAKSLTSEAIDPRGVACITFSNECALELESHLANFGISNNDRNFIGTVHSFAFTQIIIPYARCVPGLPFSSPEVASDKNCEEAANTAYAAVGIHTDLRQLWTLAQAKRKRELDRSLDSWLGDNPTLANLIEAYENNLHQRNLVDYDDMTLIALRIVKENEWVKAALRARFPVLFVDEYQDLGYALHELVKLLCLDGGMRLFAVGDVDQSIYGFNGANPQLLRELAERADVSDVRLRFNYRSGQKIIQASLDALHEDRSYISADGVSEGNLVFKSVAGGLDAEARYISDKVVPYLRNRHPTGKISILYRVARLGNIVADALEKNHVVYSRSDGNALIRRGSRLCRFIEGCAYWATGGWKVADPSYAKLMKQALGLVYAGRATDLEEQMISDQLISFLCSSIDSGERTHAWLKRFDAEVFNEWRSISRNRLTKWEDVTEMIARTGPKPENDMYLNIFAGNIEDQSCINLSTLHSAKGREFDAVVLFGMNDGGMPSRRDKESKSSMLEARRLFYVGITRAKKELVIVCGKQNCSPWVIELYKRSTGEEQ